MGFYFTSGTFGYIAAEGIASGRTVWRESDWVTFLIKEKAWKHSRNHRGRYLWLRGRGHRPKLVNFVASLLTTGLSVTLKIQLKIRFKFLAIKCYFISHQLVLAILLLEGWLHGELFGGKVSYVCDTRKSLKTLHSHRGLVSLVSRQRTSASACQFCVQNTNHWAESVSFTIKTLLKMLYRKFKVDFLNKICLYAHFNFLPCIITKKTLRFNIYVQTLPLNIQIQ